MKRTLCLVLAFVLVLGLCTIGAGAAFTDQNSVQYTNAVNTMANLGILKGFEDGSFKPAEGVTRAQAAKMIAYMMLGEANAEKMPTKQVFSDVPASHWAAKYINYCNTKGIINGLGNGTFAPNSPVTAIQLAKMLLASAGYGKNGEFVGSGWDVNVFTAAVENDLFEGSLAADYDSGATREEASLYVYNTLMNIDQVKFSKDTESYIFKDAPYAQTVWGLQQASGLLTVNEANTANFGGKSVIGGLTFEVATAEADLGHWFTVQYKVAKDADGNNINVVYAINESGVLMSGKDAKAAKLTAAGFQFVNGVETANAAPAVNEKDIAGKYVVDNTGKNIVAYIVNAPAISYGKVEIATDKTTKVTTYKVGGVDVIGAENMKNGDAVTVKKVGDFTYVYPMTKENVKITKKQTTALGTIYNGGALVFSAVDAAAELGTVKGVTLLAGAAPATLALGKTYTLYKDSLGQVWGWSEVVAEAAAIDYDNFVLVTKVYPNNSVNSLGQPVGGFFVQCVDVDGDIIYYPVVESFTFAETDIWTVSESQKAGFYLFEKAPAAVVETVDSFAKTAKIKVDANANIILVTAKGGANDAAAAAATTTKLLSALTNDSKVVYTYSVAKSGTATITNIKTAWVLKAGAGEASPFGAGYVYITAAQAAAAASAAEELNAAGKVVKTVKAYLNGALIDMTYVAGNDGTYANYKNFTAGFHQYKLNALTGEYVLEAAVAADKTIGASTEIFEGKLYISATEAFDVANLFIVDVTPLKTAEFVVTVDDLIEALNDADITVSGEFMVANKAVAGNVIYVTAK